MRAARIGRRWSDHVQSGRLAGIIGCLALVLLALPALGDLQREIDRAIAEASLEGMSIGVSVVDLRTGRRLAEVRAYEPLIPASNMKLLTSAAALMTLGEGFLFETRFVLAGDRLVVVGSGDPGLGDPALLSALPEPMDVEKLLDFIAETIVQAGPGAIREVVIDDRVFERPSVHESWPRDQLQHYYCAEVGGLNFHLNIVNVFARPTSLNQPARVAIEPMASGVEIDNTTRTVATQTSAGRPHTSALAVLRDDAGNRLRVSGAISRSIAVPTAVRDGAMLFGEMLAERLDQKGLTIGQAHQLPRGAVRRAADGERFEGRTLLFIKTPLPEVLRRCNTDSYNLHADALFKRLGHDLTREPGSWALGSAAVRTVLIDTIGPGSLDGLRIADGSGMSRHNRVSPATLSALLAHMNLHGGHSTRVLYRESLARSGQGTLRNNFLSERELRHDVLAKTGFLNGVRSISGYIAPKGGGEPVVAFSILMNNFKPTDSLRSRELRNELVRLIDREAATLRTGSLVTEPSTP